MNTTELRLPLPVNVSADEARALLAVKLYELGRVSLGQAAEVAGLSVRGLIEELGRAGVPVLRYPADDLAAEVEF